MVTGLHLEKLSRGWGQKVNIKDFGGTTVKYFGNPIRRHGPPGKFC